MILRKTWKHKEPGDQAAVGHLMEVLGVSRPIANLLVQRNIYSLDQAKAFFRPSINSMHDPFLMKDMAKAVERVSEALKKDEKILVYGDYDVDGTSAVALLYSFLSKLTPHIDFYIPDRYSEGYGVSYQGIDFAAKENFTLVITLDCGIKAIEKILYGKEKGVDFIICDHHHPGDTLPDAYAVLNPKRKDCNYPYKELSGCGVGFKFIHALSQKFNIPFDDVKPYLDLVTISIAADIVPITGENRILAYHGLDRINKNPRPGIEAALRSGGIKRRPESLAKVDYNFSKYITISDLVFVVGPRVNAAGRIDTGRNSVLLLLSETLEKSESLANMINDFNNERKCLDKQAFDDALQQIDNSLELQKKKTSVLFNKTWHKGVVGIVASRLIEHYYKPTIVFTESNGLLTGSARSIKDFDLYQAIDACSHLIEHFGGHKFAAGLSIKPENFQPFCDEFERLANETLTAEMLVPEIEIDDELNFSEMSPKFLRVLKQFAPFGPGNMAPVFHTSNVCDTGYSRPIGENHLKLNVTQPDFRGAGFDAIAFGFGSSFQKIHDERLPMKICYSIEENEWNGRVTTQLNVKDLVVSEYDSAQDD
jgi:single-stranded-DNA-specific exonuclease